MDKTLIADKMKLCMCRNRMYFLFVIFLALLLQTSCSNDNKENIEEYYDNGSLAVRYNIKEGKKDGVLYKYYQTGELNVKETWKKGKREGEVIKYYESGMINSEGFYRNNFLHGTKIIYRENGTINEEKFYEDGLLVGFNFYKENGEKNIDARLPFYVPAYDSVKLDENYYLEFKLAGSMFDSVQVILGSLDMHGTLLDTLEIMERTEGKFMYKLDTKVVGEQHVFGVFQDIKIMKDSLHVHHVPFDYYYHIANDLDKETYHILLNE